MASSTEPLGVQYHVRSISLPSRLHPNKIEAELSQLKTLGNSSFSSAEAIRVGLIQLTELYNSVRDLFQSPLTQQSLLRHQNGALVEEALEGSIGLIDTCVTVRELFSMMKENLQNLQSALRRKGGDSSVYSNIKTYVCFRKKVKKDVANRLGALKKLENNIGSSMLLEGNHHLQMVIRVLREVTALTICVFQSSLLFLSVPTLNVKPSGWSLIKKLTKKNIAESQRGQMMINEVASVDQELYSFQVRGNDAKDYLRTAERRLQMLDTSIGGLESGLECLFRRLIQTRVSLLNILDL